MASSTQRFFMLPPAQFLSFFAFHFTAQQKQQKQRTHKTTSTQLTKTANPQNQQTHSPTKRATAAAEHVDS